LREAVELVLGHVIFPSLNWHAVRTALSLRRL
jgi:hypothetical protein